MTFSMTRPKAQGEQVITDPAEAEQHVLGALGR